VIEPDVVATGAEAICDVIPTCSTCIETARTVLEATGREDRLEIARHHRDFERIRVILDENSLRQTSGDAHDKLSRIRMVVG
jgi:hypothetical protein